MYPTCHKRQDLVIFKNDGSTEHAKQCGEVSARVGELVTPEDCTACPVRDLLAEKEAARMPSPVKFSQLFSIVETTSHNQHGADWLPCECRQAVKVQGCCSGGYLVVFRCDNEKSPNYDQEVIPDSCRACGVRVKG